MKRKKLTLTILSILLLSLIIFLWLGLNNKVVITYRNIKDPRLKEDMRVLLLTDMHSCKYQEGQRELLDKIEVIQPDLILLSGDIIDDKLPMDLGFWTIEQFGNQYPTYYVTGNHEAWTNKLEMIKKRIRDMGIHVLEGEMESIQIKGNKFWIGGIDDPDAGSKIYEAQLKALEHQDKEEITFLLAHRPDKFADYLRLPVDYIFSGHAHGGQWRLPFILENGLYSPDAGLFPKYTTGIHQVDHYQIIISRGLSRESSKIPRFFNPPEMVVIDFENK